MLPFRVDLTAVLDGSSYEAGSTVRVRFAGPLKETSTERFSPFQLYASVVRTGETKAVSENRLPAGLGSFRKFRDLWIIPKDAVTGRYTVRLELRDADSGELIWRAREISFAVWRAEVKIENFAADRRFYAGGDPISFQLTIRSDAGQARRKLSLQIGAAQYPWIGPAREALARKQTSSFQTIELNGSEPQTVTVPGTVECGSGSGTVQYTAVVVDSDSSQIVAFRSTAPVFVRCPDEAQRPIYPASYIHSDLSLVRTGGYRDFYKQEPASSIFDIARTSFVAWQPNEIVLNPQRAGLAGDFLIELRTQSGELVDQCVPTREDDTLRAVLRFGRPGIYRVVVRAEDGGSSRVESLEVSANVLPRSLAILCAHPDDEFLHPAAIRVAVENSIPVHIIYLTNGDAGGSDRFFGADYSPAEAIEFGHIRMAEARAAARHLGVPESNLHFFGLADGLLDAIRTEANGSDPVFAPLLGADHSPYYEAVRPNLPFERQAVLKALATLLMKIDPDVVYTSHPDERHADHRAAGRLAIDVLKMLLASGKLTSVPSLRADQFYGAGKDEPAPFSYRVHEFFSSGEVMARVQEAYWFYQTQGGNHARGHVLSYEDLPRIERHQEIVNWAASVEPPSFALETAV